MVHIFLSPPCLILTPLHKKEFQPVCASTPMRVICLGESLPLFLLPQQQIPLQRSPSAAVETFSHGKQSKQERWRERGKRLFLRHKSRFVQHQKKTQRLERTIRLGWIVSCYENDSHEPRALIFFFGTRSTHRLSHFRWRRSSSKAVVFKSIGSFPALVTEPNSTKQDRKHSDVTKGMKGKRAARGNVFASQTKSKSHTFR